MITATNIQLFQILKQKLGDQEAEALVNFVDAKLKENDEANLKVLATKEDMFKLENKIGGLEGRMEAKMAELKADMIKWMFLFWIGQVAVTFGFILLFLKK